MEKQEILANLLGIRAGLSAISQESDVIKACEGRSQMVRDEEDDLRVSLRNSKNLLAEAENDYRKNVSEVENAKKEYERVKAGRFNSKEYDYIDQEANRKVSKPKFFIPSGELCDSYSDELELTASGHIWLWSSIVPVIISLFIGFCSQNPSSLVRSIAFIGWFGFLFYPIVCTLSYIIRRIAYGIRLSRNKRTQESLLLEKRKEEYNVATKKLELAHSTLNNRKGFVESTNTKITKYDSLTPIRENNRIIESHAKRSKAIHDSLIATYSDFLSVSEWKYVDLIVYYISTGRADTMKEALQLLDRQVQTNQIISAISIAKDEVRATVENSMLKLGEALSQSFNMLNANITRIGYSIEDMGTQMQSSQRAIESASGRLLSATEMNNALLKKSNETSETLLNDLRYNQRFWVK